MLAFKRGVDPRAQPGQLLDHQTVLLGLEVHGMGAFAADHLVAAMEAGKGLKTRAAALIAGHHQLDPLGGRRVFDIERGHVGSPGAGSRRHNKGAVQRSHCPVTGHNMGNYIPELATH